MRFRKGYVPWNKGTKGIIKPNVGCFKKGKTPWNKGKRGIYSEETRKKISDSLKGRKGFHHSEETKRKISLARMGNTNYIKFGFKKGHKKYPGIEKTWIKKGQHLSRRTEFKKGLIPWITGKKHNINTQIKMRLKRALQITPFKDTKIEKKIRNFLKRLNIEFIAHQYIKEIEHNYQCDFFIPSMNMIIECDGDYWHGNPLVFSNPNKQQKEQIEEDKIRTKELKDKGFKVLRLWEKDINKLDINNFKRIIELK